MSARYDLSKPAGVISYFQERVNKRANKLARRRKSGNAPPVLYHYLEFARQDLVNVKKLLKQGEPV